MSNFQLICVYKWVVFVKNLDGFGSVSDAFVLMQNVDNIWIYCNISIQGTIYMQRIYFHRYILDGKAMS